MKNKILTALLSVGIALGLWLYVVTVVSPNSDKHYYNIPVVMQGETLLQERGLMITTTEQPTVSLHLEGNRTDLDKLNTSNITINVDVSRVYETGTHNLSFTPTYPGDVPNNAITVLSKNPGTITVTVEERVSKTVPVDIQYVGTLSEGYMADKENKVLDFENVNIVGPKGTIDRIAMARIDVDLEARSESISGQFRYTLCDEKGAPVDAELVTTDVENINLTLKILRVKEIALLVNVVEGGGANLQNTTVTVEPGTIRISGSDNLLENLESLELSVVNLEEIAEDTVLTFPIKLPEGINNETGVTEATVDVKFNNLETKTLTVRNFTPINVPEGLTADVITRMLEVKIRGPKNAIKNITADDITVTVDFSQEQAGTVSVKAKITVDAEGVGAVGIYNITATLKERR